MFYKQTKTIITSQTHNNNKNYNLETEGKTILIQADYRHILSYMQVLEEENKGMYSKMQTQLWDTVINSNYLYLSSESVDNSDHHVIVPPLIFDLAIQKLFLRKVSTILLTP